MNWLIFRDAVSAWSHAVWLLLSVPAALVLLWRCWDNPVKRFSFVVYGLTMALCSGASTVYHAVRLPPGQVAAFRALDHIGIYLFIAGCITPVALCVLRARWQWGTLIATWFLATVGVCLYVAPISLPISSIVLAGRTDPKRRPCARETGSQWLASAR